MEYALVVLGQCAHKHAPVRLPLVLDERHVNVVSELALQYFAQRNKVLLEPSSCPNQIVRLRDRGE